MTRTQLLEAVKREGRVKANDQLDDMILGIIDEILTDYCNLARYDELLVTNQTLTFVAEQQEYDLPADFMHFEKVRFGVGATPTSFTDVKLQPPGVRQTQSYGYPRFYRIVRGPKVSFWPYGAIRVADTLTYDYYVTPTSVFADDADEFPIPRLEAAVKKAAIARVQRFHAGTTEAQMTDSDAGRSFNAADAGA